jgi:hypothetical protein
MAEKIHYLGDGNRGPRGGKLYVFHCPGCGYGHLFEIDCPNGNGWAWNGSLDKPTFTPSLLVGKDLPELRCHSFVTGGRIQFLGDCFHALAGQTVDIPDWSQDDSGF